MVQEEKYQNSLWEPPAPGEFVHHEHIQYFLLPVIHPDNRIELYDHVHLEPGKVIAARTCGFDDGSGRLILNVKPPDQEFPQVVKLDGKGWYPVNVTHLPPIRGQATRPILVSMVPEFRGYFLLGCGSCQEDLIPRLSPVSWTVDAVNKHVVVLMECSRCHRQAYVKFDAAANIAIGPCSRHPLEVPPRRAPRQPAPVGVGV